MFTHQRGAQFVVLTQQVAGRTGIAPDRRLHDGLVFIDMARPGGGGEGRQVAIAFERIEQLLERELMRNLPPIAMPGPMGVAQSRSNVAEELALRVAGAE